MINKFIYKLFRIVLNKAGYLNKKMNQFKKNINNYIIDICIKNLFEGYLFG